MNLNKDVRLEGLPRKNLKPGGGGVGQQRSRGLPGLEVEPSLGHPVGGNPPRLPAQQTHVLHRAQGVPALQTMSANISMFLIHALNYYGK